MFTRSGLQKVTLPIVKENRSKLALVLYIQSIFVNKKHIFHGRSRKTNKPRS